MTTAREWLEEVRGLDLETLTRLGVKWGPGRRGETIAIPYRVNGEVRAHKIRRVGEDRKGLWDGDAKAIGLFNGDVLDDETLRSQPVIITEGEFDALSVLQCGFPRTVSVPHGAQSGGRYVYEDAKRLRDSPCVIVAGDDDPDGHQMRRDVANALEGHPVRWTQWPEGCKDANDVLRKHDEATVKACIEAATLVFPDDPKGGLITGFSDAPPPPSGRVYRAGVPSIDKICAWHEGFPTVVTGVPGSGKSTWLTWALHNVGRSNGIRIAASLLETPWTILRDHLARLDCGAPYDELSASERTVLTERIDRDWRLLHRVEDDVAHDLGWFREMMRAASVRDGCRIIVLDPWNEVEHRLRQGESMTDYVTDALTHVRRWAERYDVAVCIVAHPTKMQREAGGKQYPPLGYDISGSASWYNKTAIGVTIHRDRDEFGEYTQAICWKSKFTQLYGFDRGRVSLLFDPYAMTYSKRPKMEGMT